jgi:hypothetical protein
VGAALAACAALVFIQVDAIVQVDAAAFPSLSVLGLRARAADAGGR